MYFNPNLMKNYISYYRVSTIKQGNSGLGLESQKNSVHDFIKSNNGNLIQEFQEVASGKSDKREILLNAIDACVLHNATLIVKKLDRLSRGGFKIAVQLQELGVNYIESDSPTDSQLLKDIKLSMAKDERSKISERTKAALQVLKDRGVKLGTKGKYNLTDEGRAKGAMTNKIKAEQNPNYIKARTLIASLKKQGLTLQQMTNKLNEADFKTSTGKQFKIHTVKRIVSKLKQVA